MFVYVNCLIYLNSAVDLPHEPQTRAEPHCACEKEEGEWHHAHVGEVEDRWHELSDLKLRIEVPDRVEE